MYKKEFEMIFDYAKDKVDDIEILLSANKSFSTKINEQLIEAFNYADSKGIGVRVIKGGKIGYAYTEKFDKETFSMIVDEAVANAECSEDDEIAVMENYSSVDKKLNIYSEELEKIDVKEKIQFAKDMEKYAKATDNRVFNVPYAQFGNGTTYSRIENSKGLCKEEKQNFAYAYVGALSQEKDDKRVGVEFIIGRDFSKFKAKELAEKSVEKSTALLGGESIKSGSYPVIFNNEMMATMLSTFSGIFSAQSVQEGRSLLKGKLGQLIANDKVTVKDDGLYPGGFSTSAFDSEGYPSQTTILILNGKLRSYLHNTITARKDGVNSTGNGSRNYKNTLRISPSNIYLEKGQHKETDLYNKYDRVIEIVAMQGMHSGANPISGDFSLSAEGFLYENGKKKHSLKPFTISGNILQLFKDVDMIADNFKFDMSSVGAASVLVKELAISG